MPDLSLERALHARGISNVVGVDEAGRGPLAGPVSAGAVILPSGFSCPGLDDSKKLSAVKRARLYETLTTCAEVKWSVALVHAEEIDRINILRATHLAMEQAVRQLGVEIGHCLIDGLRLPKFPWTHDGIVKGDGLSLSIAAASIIAKVTRDRWMLEASEEFSQYGFERHQGYGTKAHLIALKTHGPCRIHRRSFQPVAQLALPLGEA
jgi:ribonuclease HII